MSLDWKDVIVSFSISNLFFLRVWHELIFAEPQGLFYLKTPGFSEIIALLLNVIILGIVFIGLFYILRTYQQPSFEKLISLILIFSFLFPLNALRLLATDLSITDIANFLGRFGAVFVVIVFIAAFTWLAIKKSKALINAVSIIYLILSPFLLVSFAQAGWALITMEDPDTQLSVESQLEKISSAEDKGPDERIVWFIFDELDQRLTFEERPDDLEIPALKGLKEKGFYATAAKAPEDETILSMPAFLAGEKIKSATPKAIDELKLKSADADEEFSWGDKKNIFDRVNERDGKTALSGVFLPYCRIIQDSLDFCSWQPFGTVKHNTDYGIFEAMLTQFRAPFAISPFNQRQHAMDVHKEIYNDAVNLVKKDELNLVLVHWSIPHYPWIYDREQEDFSRWNYDLERGYYDNLALVDKTIADMKAAMQEANTWDNTHLIVSSDHPWRMHLFPTYDDKYDDRIPFLVRFAGEENKVKFEESFNTVITHDIILEILDGEISNPEELYEWLNKR